MENKPSTESQKALEQLVSELGGPEELLGLLADYRQITTAFVSAKDPSSALPQMRCWWTKKQKIRMAADLPEQARGAFLK